MNFKSSGAVGDIVYSLWCVRDMIQRSGGNGTLYLHAGLSATNFYENHPSGSQRMSREMAESLLPLLRSQDYLHAELYDGQEIDVDLDLFRMLQVDYWRGSIPKYYFWTFQSWADVSQPALLGIEADQRFTGRLVCGHTNRYTNPRISYQFLNEYQPIFLGLPSEFDDFKKQVPNAEYHQTKDLLEVAQVLRACKCYVGNQSAIFAVAEALKCPRVLETCLTVQNVVPAGPGGRDAINQLGMEWHVKELMNV